jgi:hypothetical protein
MAGESTPGIISALPSSTKDTPADLEDAGGTGEYKLFTTDLSSSPSPASSTLGVQLPIAQPRHSVNTKRERSA